MNLANFLPKMLVLGSGLQPASIKVCSLPILLYNVNIVLVYYNIMLL